MKQVTRKNRIIKKKVATKKQRKHPLFGTSKLEEDFARYFLNVLGIKYIYQFEAKSIGRWFDFFLPEHNLLIEIDGGYW